MTQGSDLATAAEHHIDLRAGPERAVAATKTYTAELLAIALLVTALEARLGPVAGRDEALAAVPDALAAALDTEPGGGGGGPPSRRPRSAHRRRARVQLRDGPGDGPQAQGAGSPGGRSVLGRRLPPRAARPGRAGLPGDRAGPVRADSGRHRRSSRPTRRSSPSSPSSSPTAPKRSRRAASGSACRRASRTG